MALRASVGLRDSEEIAALLQGIVAVNVSQLRRGLCPPLYQSGVRYQREDPGREVWQTAVETYRLGYGDCEDLAAYWVAGMHLVGNFDWECAVIDVVPGLKHCVARHKDGTIEDPSKRLGMRGKG